jgi:tetratricopeptide (TPR) repeat protein
MAFGNGGYAFGGTLEEDGLNGVAVGPSGTKRIRGGQPVGAKSPFAADKEEEVDARNSSRKTQIAPGITLTQNGSGVAGIELNLGNGGPAAISWGNALSVSGRGSDESPLSIDVGGLQLDFSEEGMRAPRSALNAFRSADYSSALKHLESALGGIAANRDLGQLESLIHFAKNDYQLAADAAYRALADGPGWQWDVLRDFYDDQEDYTSQLRALEQATLDAPDSAANHFLLAYHYTMLGHYASAERHLTQAGKMLPQDTVVEELLELVRAKSTKNTPPPPPAAEES